MCESGECVRVVSSSVEVELAAEDSRQSTEVVQWERFLPKMVLRVLLVESDESTRQIIAALLRKCRYKVSTVPNALKAWETLRDKPHSIDVVLTEVELPSVSGFSLLTLVMKHDVSKNIPVIMMSSHDSISMVLKCMLKGAADFLIKPVRKNELRNLWQHVWRRHTLTSGCILQNLSVTQQNVEASTENNTASNHSSDHVVSSHRENDSSKKGLKMRKCKNVSNLSNCDTEKHREMTKLHKVSVIQGREPEERSSKFGAKIATCKEANHSIALRLEKDPTCAKGMTHYVSVESKSAGNDNIKSGTNCRSNEPEEPLSRAIDLIGTFDYTRSMCSHVDSSSINSGSNKVEYIPQLGLSSSRFCPSSLKDDEAGERCSLNHSSASAFSWYNNTKTLQSLIPTQRGNFTKLEEGTGIIHDLLSHHGTENTVGTSLIHGQSGQAEIVFPRPRLGPVPVLGLTHEHDDICVRYGHVLPSLFYIKSNMLTALGPKPACQEEQSPSVEAITKMNSLKQGYTSIKCDDQTVNVENNSEAMEARHDSPAGGGGGKSYSILCNGVATGLGGSVHVTGSTCSSSNKVGSQHTSQREAALLKFRLKRKNRCCESKVRYQSRKRVAGQRTSAN